MAGVEGAKLGSSALDEMGCHYDTVTRASEKVAHSNESINKALTHQNYFLGCSGWEEARNKIKATIEEADALNPPKRVRADRKTWVDFVVWCPPELEGTIDEDRFFQEAYTTLEKECPGGLYGTVHKDERHEYYDPDKKELVRSRIHGHYLAPALTKPAKENGRINCKEFLSPEKCQRVNDAIQEMCLREFGVSYQTGEGRKGKKRSVEDIKGRSQVMLEEKLAKEGLTVVAEKRQELTEVEEKLEENKALISSQEEAMAFNWEFLSSQEKQVEVLEERKVSIWTEIADKVKEIIDNFTSQVKRQKSLEKRVPPIKREKVFGKANEHQKAFWGEVPSTYEKIGKVEAPEASLRQILEQYDKELTQIEADQNKPVKEESFIAEDNFEM